MSNSKHHVTAAFKIQVGDEFISFKSGEIIPDEIVSQINPKVLKHLLDSGSVKLSEHSSLTQEKYTHSISYMFDQAVIGLASISQEDLKNIVKKHSENIKRLFGFKDSSKDQSIENNNLKNDLDIAKSKVEKLERDLEDSKKEVLSWKEKTESVKIEKDSLKKELDGIKKVK